MNFGAVLPELVKTSDPLVLVAGATPKPSDAWRILTLKTVGGVFIDKLPDTEIELVKTNRSTIQPTTSRPRFYEEGENIFLLPTNVTDDVIARYVQSIDDIAVITSNIGLGNFIMAPGTYTLATKTLQATMNIPFSVGDENKRVMFHDGTEVFEGKITAVVGIDTVTLYGDGLPTGDIPVIQQVMVSDVSPDTRDIPVNQVWDAELVQRMVKMATEDASRSLLS